MNTDWNGVRGEFPALRRWAYLNTATYGQVPVRGVQAVAEHFAHRDELACADFLAWYEEADRIRGAVARLIGAESDDIAFIPNSSAALGLMAGGMDWRPGDNVVTLAGEFPNCLYLPALVERHAVEFRAATWERFYDSIDERTRLVALSEVNYVTGFRAPLEEISRFVRQRGILLFVDGTQSVGALRFDVRRFQPDMLAVHAYKWMISPTGVGFLYAAPGLREKLAPNVAGWRTDRDWRNVNELRHGNPEIQESADRYEGGGLPFGLLNAMGAVVEWMLELGPEKIEARVLGLADEARMRLSGLGANIADHGSQIVAARFPGVDASKLAAELKGRGILVAARHGMLRVSPHFYNTEGDLERLVDVLRELR